MMVIELMDNEKSMDSAARRPKLEVTAGAQNVEIQASSIAIKKSCLPRQWLRFEDKCRLAPLIIGSVGGYLD
jgi:hypothetical protein